MRSNNRKNDDFDFGLDQQIEQDPPVKPLAAKPKQPSSNDFFDLDDQLQPPKGKLPVINQRSSAKLLDNKGKRQADTKLEELRKKDVTYDYLDEELEDEKPIVNKYAPPTKVETPKQVGRKEEDYEEEYKEPQPEPEPEPEQEHHEENYGEDFDDYGEDFDEFHDDHKEESPKKPQKVQKPQQKKPPLKQPVIKVTKQPTTRSKTINKPALQRANSRGSLKSHKSNRSQNRAKTNLTMQPQQPHTNKFQQQVSNSFPQIDLQKLSLDNLNKLNDRVRAMIRKFNDQLNDILTKNTLLLKAKKQGKQEKGVEDRLKVLAEEKKNNEKVLERMDEEVKRMRFREGKIKDEDYEVDIHRRIMAMTENKKEIEKEIVRLKLGVENEGKRLTTGAEKKQSSGQNAFKTDIVYQKKQQIRLADLIANLDKKLEEMQPKYNETETKLNVLWKEAANAGIDLAPKTGLKAKYDELVKKQEAERKGLAMMQGNVKSKKQKNQQQIILLRRNVQSMDAQIKNIYGQIDHVLQQCRNVISSAKTNPKLPKTLQQSLQLISRSLVANQPMQFDRISRNSVHSEKPRMMSADRSKKHDPSDDFLPLNPKKLAKNVEQQIANPAPVHKPNFKKKDVSVSLEEKNVERVWKDEQQGAEGLREPPVILQQKTIPVSVPQVAEVKEVVVEDGSKPKFMLKKRGNNMSANNISEQQQPVKDIPKEQPVRDYKPPAINQDEKKTIEIQKPFGNRMMRLRKNDNNSAAPGYSLQPPKQPPKDETIAYNSAKPEVETKPALNPFGTKTPSQNKLVLNDHPIQDTPVTESVVEEQPIIGPRRIMLRKRGGEEEGGNGGGGGYNPNFVKKDEPAPAPAPNPPPRNINISLKDENPSTKPANNPYAPTVQPQKPVFTNPYAPKVQQKPIQNISNPYAPRISQTKNDDIPVRDVPKLSNISNPYAPKQQAPVIQPSPNPSTNLSNPYAPSNLGGNAPQRQRQGRLKKNKIQITKQKITNIYEAAEQHVVNEFIPEVKPTVKQPEPVIQQKQHKHEELDLNALLGINSKPKNDPEDELIFGGNKKVEEKKVAPVRKKQQDFFGEFDV